MANLIDCIEELKEDRSEATGEVGLCLVASVCETMTERQPVFLDKRCKTFQRSVERIEKNLCEAHHLNTQSCSNIDNLKNRGRLHHLLTWVEKSQPSSRQIITDAH